MDLTLLALAKGYTDKQIEKAEMGGFQLDPSLTKEGFAADAKAVGEAISKTVGAPGPEGPQGPQGEPGTSGVHVGTEPPTDDTANVWVNVDENVSIPDFIQSPSTASIGQTIVVKAVDENGKPTEWEAVDMAGGGSNFIPVFGITLDEDVKAIDITHFNNGKAISLSDARVYMVFEGTSQNTTENAVSIEPWGGTEYLARSQNVSFDSASRTAGTLNAFAELHIKCKSGYMLISAETRTDVVHLYGKGEDEPTITKLRLWSDGFIGAGTTIEVWGIEA